MLCRFGWLCVFARPFSAVSDDLLMLAVFAAITLIYAHDLETFVAASTGAEPILRPHESVNLKRCNQCLENACTVNDSRGLTIFHSNVTATGRHRWFTLYAGNVAVNVGHSAIFVVIAVRKSDCHSANSPARQVAASVKELRRAEPSIAAWEVLTLRAQLAPSCSPEPLRTIRTAALSFK